MWRVHSMNVGVNQGSFLTASRFHCTRRWNNTGVIKSEVAPELQDFTNKWRIRRQTLQLRDKWSVTRILKMLISCCNCDIHNSIWIPRDEILLSLMDSLQRRFLEIGAVLSTRKWFRIFYEDAPTTDAAQKYSHILTNDSPDIVRTFYSLRTIFISC
jgi:hypothetical protein